MTDGRKKNVDAAEKWRIYTESWPSVNLTGTAPFFALRFFYGRNIQVSIYTERFLPRVTQRKTNGGVEIFQLHRSFDGEKA